MPHQCVRCNTFYEDGAQEILNGCTCGGKLFFFVSKAKIEKAKQIAEMPVQDKEQIEKDILEIVGEKADSDAPVILDIEAINVVKPGKFEIDLAHLFTKDQPLIYKLEEGKYVIDLATSFKRLGKDKDADKKE
ncbi:MAG: Zn-ribbon containing protein [Candidatus Woesearchaeota archaeon]